MRKYTIIHSFIFKQVVESKKQTNGRGDIDGNIIGSVKLLLQMGSTPHCTQWTFSCKQIVGVEHFPTYGSLLWPSDNNHQGYLANK